MNYMAEVKVFYARQAIAPLSVQGQAIWQYFMFLANANFYVFPLVLGEMQIRGTVGMSHGAFVGARKELVAGGYIVYEPQPGRKKAHYYIVSHAIPRNTAQLTIRGG